MVRDFVGFPGVGKDFNDFLAEFQSETDRAAAVLAAAYADELLKSLIEATFVDNSRYVKDLTRRGGPISSFSARISLAYAIALISKNDAADLHRLREIRNDFAHRLHGITFASQTVSDRSREFRCVALIFKRTAGLRERYPNDSRKLFDLAVAYLCFKLQKRISRARPLAYAKLSVDPQSN